MKTVIVYLDDAAHATGARGRHDVSRRSGSGKRSQERTGAEPEQQRTPRELHVSRATAGR